MENIDFLFYLGYIGLLHFGFIDAMYLKYGGNNKEALNKNLLKKSIMYFVLSISGNGAYLYYRNFYEGEFNYIICLCDNTIKSKCVS